MGLSWWSVTDASSESSAFLLFSGPLVSDMLQPPISRSHQPVLSIKGIILPIFPIYSAFSHRYGLMLQALKAAQTCFRLRKSSQAEAKMVSSCIVVRGGAQVAINGHQWPWIAMNSPIWCLSKKGATGRIKLFFHVPWGKTSWSLSMATIRLMPQLNDEDVSETSPVVAGRWRTRRF